MNYCATRNPTTIPEKGKILNEQASRIARSLKERNYEWEIEAGKLGDLQTKSYFLAFCLAAPLFHKNMRTGFSRHHNVLPVRPRPSQLLWIYKTGTRLIRCVITSFLEAHRSISRSTVWAENWRSTISSSAPRSRSAVCIVTLPGYDLGLTVFV